MIAAVYLEFDPSVTFFGLGVRLETLALAAALLVGLVLTALAARRLERGFVRLEAQAAASPDSPGSGSERGRKTSAGRRRLHSDDLLLIAVGAIPGAVVGGRLEYGLLHLDYYRTHLGSLVDPAQGGMALTGAVVLGTISAIAVARLLAAPTRLWLQVASAPLLVALGLGKLAMVLGGSGQGQFSEASWASAYLRPGPWGSASASDPALPSQALEGALVLLAALALVAAPRLLRVRLRRWRNVVRPELAPDANLTLLTGATRFLVALGLWSAARFAAAFTWRDAPVLGPLRSEQLLLLGLVAGCVFLLASRPAWRRGRAGRVARRRAALRRLAMAREVAPDESTVSTDQTAAPGSDGV